MILGLDDPFVAMAYLSILALAAFSIIYGTLRRHAAPDEITEEDHQWALEEQQVDDER
ncbi:hypothetical protein GWK36_04155 [Caldichromatium japonicum]|uniref:Uncharacterized protein n=1 Tax=Caldichromatium japonicum TaxID=2699430 RepID=A0A6G7VBT9_9GAMM|nr:symporter small accessory protein [Caldichromatium japonicum]QIK37318.1 hypothetical protein GWK36_04155 [Caldichromatium japonicum]